MNFTFYGRMNCTREKSFNEPLFNKCVVLDTVPNITTQKDILELPVPRDRSQTTKLFTPEAHRIMRWKQCGARRGLHLRTAEASLSQQGLSDEDSAN